MAPIVLGRRRGAALGYPTFSFDAACRHSSRCIRYIGRNRLRERLDRGGGALGDLGVVVLDVLDVVGALDAHVGAVERGAGVLAELADLVALGDRQAGGGLDAELLGQREDLLQLGAVVG